MKTLWVLVSVLLCTGTFATEVQKSKTCTGASCSPSLTTPYIVNDINSDSSSSKLVKPVVLDASQSRLGLHLQASNIVPPTTPGAIPATSFYDPLDDDAGNPVVLNTPPKLPLLEGHDLSGDTTEVEDQQLLDAIKGTYTLTPPAGDVQSFTDAIKQQAEAELAAQDGMVSTGSALGDATLSGGSSTDTSAAGSGTGMSDAAMEAAMAATVPGSSNSAATPSETQIDAQLARISKNDPRLGGLVAVEQTAQAQAAVMKRAAAILKLLDKAYGELGAKLAAVATQRTALRHQYLNTREYLHALHLHALKLLKEDTDVPYTPADLSTSNTPAAQFLNGLPASAASMTSAGAILAKIQDLLLAASGQTLVPSGSGVADNSGCCGNDPISRELQALINGGATTGGETTTTGNTGGELPPFSSTAFVQSLIPPSSTGSETPTPEPSSTASSVVTGGTTTPVASTVDVVASTGGGGGGGTQTSSSAAAMMLIDDAEFARIEHEAQEDLQEKERRREATAKKHRHKHHRDNEPDDVADISVKETAKSTDSSNEKEKTKSKTGMDDPRDWVKHFGELSKDAQTVSSIPAVPDPDHITLENLPILEAALTGKLPKADEAPHLDPLPQIPAVSLLETSSSTRSTAKVMEPNIAELMASVKSKMAQTNSIVAQLKALKDRNEHMDTDPQQRAAEAQELAALQRGEEVYSKSGRSTPVRDSHTITVTPTDMLSALRDLKEPDAASVHATDANFPSFDELGLLETKTTTKHHAAAAAAHKLPTQPADDSLGLPVFPSEPPMEVDPKVDQDIVAAAMAVEVRPHPHHRRRAASEGSFLEVDSTVKQGSDRNFRAEIAHQEHVLDQLHNKYSRSEYTDTLREVLGDPVMSAGGDFVGTSHVTRVQGGNHPRLVESIQSDLDRNANNMYQDVMAAARGEDGDDVLFSHDSDPMEFRQRKRGPSNGIGVMADVSASNINDKYVFPELDIPDLHLKTVKTPSAQLASLMNNGPQPADNVNELIETYKRSLEGPSDNEQQQWDDLEQLREHTTVTPSVQKLLNEAQIVLSGGSLSHPHSHYNNADLAGALSFIDEGLSHPIPKHHMTADEAYQRVLRVTNPGAPKKNVVTHHSNNHKRADDVSFIQEHTHTESHQQRKRHKEPDLHHAKDLSVEELTRLATRHIKAGEKEIRKIEDFQQELIAKDPAKFKDLEATHNLLHEPVVHHHHHSEPTAMLETSSTITSTKKHNHHDSTPVPDILIEQAARRATENAEDGIDALLAKAAGAIDQDQQLVKDMDGTHAKIRSIQKEYDAIRKSDASDMAVLRQEEELITKTKSHGHQAKAADITNEQLSLLEDAATTMEHKGARRVKAKMDAQTEKRRRRKHGHHS